MHTDSIIIVQSGRELDYEISPVLGSEDWIETVISDDIGDYDFDIAEFEFDFDWNYS
jgi:hypothetical protein